MNMPKIDIIIKHLDLNMRERSCRNYLAYDEMGD